MKFNSTGDAAHGLSQVAVNGVVPAALAGLVAGSDWGPAWLTDDILIFQYQAGTNVYRIGTYTISTTTFTPNVSTSGATAIRAGGGVWLAFLVGSGVRTNVSGYGPFSQAALMDCDLSGISVLIASYQTGSGLRVYSTAGVLLQSYNATLVYGVTTLRGNLLAYNTSAGWFLSNVSTGAGLTYVQRAGVNWVTPVVSGGNPWVLERTNTLMIRQPTASVAYDLSPIGYTEHGFNQDVMEISAGVVRIGACTDAAESPNSLLLCDLTLATGDTSVGTIVAGALSFSAGPTLALSTVTTGSTTTGGSGGSGGSGGAGAGPSGSNIIRTVTRPRLPRSSQPKTYPHVAQITVPQAIIKADAPIAPAVREAIAASQQSTRLLWDSVGRLTKTLDATETRFTEQAEVNRRLQAQLTAVEFQAQESAAVAAKVTAQDLPPGQPGPTLPPDDGQVGGPPPPPAGGGAVVVPGTVDAIDASAVTWMTTDVGNWPIGATLTNIAIDASQICLDYTGKNVWPAVDPSNDGILSPGNPWVIAFIGGQYYGSTYEWLRVGQICKNVTGPEFQDYVTGTSPLDTWTPALGETVWFMVSSLARQGPQSPYNQRTQIVATVWPY